MEYTIPSPMRAIDALRKIYPDSSRRTLQTWLQNGRFCVDGKPLRREDALLVDGQKVQAKETFRAPKVPGLKILYEDRHIIVIDKPVGLLSVPLDEGLTKRHALGLLHHHYETDQIFAVHRIDRGTSGILMFARGKLSEKYFDELFEKHDVLREYFAIVEGRVKDNEGTWECNLLELPSYHVIDSPEGKKAVTHYSVIRRSAKYTYLKLRLETGRKHQIRVHCQMAGHPVLGDDRYGAVENPLKRLCLHACTLGFIHPSTRKAVKFSSPLPGIFQALGAKKAS
ncbi:MAG TPA: RluA family pseudouridine synthase [Chlamydiales bacterium]|nr:RluA family pseudouridine synthase [Chlamydiales bacterium]